MSQTPRRPLPTGNRRGAITVWLILAIPVLMTLFCLLLEVGNLWLARIELTNALESSSLAAVKEWGDNGGGDTWIPRNVGNTYAMANTVNGSIVDLMLVDDDTYPLNYDEDEECNQNACSLGVLVFGVVSINEFDEFVFDCCETAGCGGPFNVQLDVTGDGNLFSGENNEWGISVQPTGVPDTGVRVTRVIYRLPDMFMALDPVFDFSSDPATVSDNLVDNLGDNLVQCDASPDELICPPDPTEMGTSQADVFGVDPNEVQFYINVPYGDDGMDGRLECEAGSGTLVAGPTGIMSKTLAVEFCNPEVDPMCEPFDPGDRIRFGALVTDLGGSQIDGDEIGQMMTEVTICFSDGTHVQLVFEDTHHREMGQDGSCANVTFPSWGQCETPGRKGMTFPLITDGGGSGLPPDVPPPASQGNMNNGQSLTSTDDEGTGRPFAVRAQATYEVPSICCQFCGIPIGPFTVSAKADALYDCTLRQPRLYHLEDRNYHCDVDCND
jgi:Flp pilus assembly protein TadG